MTLLSKSADTQYFLDLTQGDGPIELSDITVLATFDNRNVQANISTDQFTFTGDQAEALLQQIADGLSGGVGIYERPKYLIKAINDQNSIGVLNGFLDLPGIEDLTEDIFKVRMKVVKEDGLNTFNKRLEGLTYGRLEGEGFITQSDYATIDYVVEEKLQFIEVSIMTITLYLMAKTLADQIRILATDITNATAHTAGGLSGPAAGIIFTVAILLIEVAYAIALVIAIINLATQQINALLPPVRQHKVASYRKLLEVAANKLGYNFISPITDLDLYFNLPSNERLDNVDDNNGLFTLLKGTPSGIPRPSDNGYFCEEFYNRCKAMFNAEIAIIGTDVHFRTLSDPWWVKQSTYVMPDVSGRIKRYNREELIESRNVAFRTDTTDRWTVDQFKGTNYEITTLPKIINNPKAVAIDGREKIQFQVALGNRKDQLNGLENILSKLAGIVDSVVNTLGGSSDLQGKIENKVGILKVSRNDYAVPKVLILKNGKIPVNHRDLLSAKYLYDTYINEKSFVANNFGGQKTVYENVRIPFGLNDFISLINNSYATAQDGKIAKFTKLKWNIDGDFANADFYIKEPHTNNLKEEFLEVE